MATEEVNKLQSLPPYPEVIHINIQNPFFILFFLSKIIKPWNNFPSKVGRFHTDVIDLCIFPDLGFLFWSPSLKF